MGLQQRLLWLMEDEAPKEVVIESPTEFEQLRWEAIAILLKQLGFSQERLNYLARQPLRERTKALTRCLSALKQGCSCMYSAMLVMEIMINLWQCQYDRPSGKKAPRELYSCDDMRQYIATLRQRFNS